MSHDLADGNILLKDDFALWVELYAQVARHTLRKLYTAQAPVATPMGWRLFSSNHVHTRAGRGAARPKRREKSVVCPS